MTVINKFVNVDFTTPPEGFQTGLLEQTDDEIMAASPMQGFEEEYPHLMIPKGQRKELALQRRDRYRRSTRKIYSQGRTSACVGFGSAQAFETMFTRRYGVKRRVSFAGMDVYNFIGRTLMSGAYIPDGMNRLVNYGVLPLDTPNNNQRFRHTIDILDWRKKPQGAEATRQQFRVSKWARAQGPDEIESALISGFCGIVGRSRHCVPYVYLDYSDRGSPVVSYANSWSSNWGDKGFGYDSRSVYKNLTLYLILEIVIPKFIAELV